MPNPMVYHRPNPALAIPLLGQVWWRLAWNDFLWPFLWPFENLSKCAHRQTLNSWRRTQPLRTNILKLRRAHRTIKKIGPNITQTTPSLSGPHTDHSTRHLFMYCTHKTNATKTLKGYHTKRYKGRVCYIYF